jgi:hypothetical protein
MKSPADARTPTLSPPKFEDKYEEREYLKGRLAAAFRIFGKYGFDEGVAGASPTSDLDDGAHTSPLA